MALRYLNQKQPGRDPRAGTRPSDLSATGPRLPANARPMSTVPLNSATPVWIYDRTGRGFRSIYHQNGWQKLSLVRDPFNGTSRWQMTGKGSVDMPIAWSSS